MPEAVGVKETEIVQLPDAAIAPAVQFCVSAKSPEITTEVTFSVAPPELVSVTFCVALVVFTLWPGKVKGAAGESVTAATPVPVPEAVKLCGVPTVLSVIVKVAE